MSHKMTKLLTLPALFATMAMIHAPLQAQENRVMEEIEVTAPRVTTMDRPFGTGKTRVVHKKALVNTADLDLRKSSDMMMLEKRVRTAAERVCRMLEEDMPFGQPSQDVCTQRAVMDTMASVRETVSSMSS